jgi:hypothetical protein
MALVAEQTSRFRPRRQDARAQIVLTTIPAFDLVDAYDRSAALCHEIRDIALERAGPQPPAWVIHRGWLDYLSGLGDVELERADTEGIDAWFLSDVRCPPSLADLAQRVRSLTTAIPHLPFSPPDFEASHMNVRKRGQVATIVKLLGDAFPALSELVDIGAGHGHLTMHAAEALSVPTVGLERNRECIATARALSAGRPVRFIDADVLAADNPLRDLSPDPNRLLMALHGCGDLGDAVVQAAVATRSRVLLLPCCPQKIRGSQRSSLMSDLCFPREVLGLANVLARTTGIEGDLRQALATKESRIALRYLLAARGCAIPPGEEMRGVNRRKANAGFTAFAEAVCHARHFAPPSPDEIASAARRAHAHYQAQRRFSLPRSMLGRVLEIYLALDRATFLQSHDYTVRLVQVFPTAYSPRNLGILGELSE